MDQIVEKQTPLDKERLLKGWIEQKSKDAFAVYGTASETLRRILITGSISSSPITLDYQREYTEGGKHLYFTFPFLVKVQEVSKELTERMKGSVPDPDYSFDEKNIRRAATHYAIRDSLTKPFVNLFPDVNWQTVLALAKEVIPDKLSAYSKDMEIDYPYVASIDGEEINIETDVARGIKASYSKEELRKILSEVLKKRGVLI